MKKTIDGKAIVYADGAFNTPNGKTAHGLVRFTERGLELGEEVFLLLGEVHRWNQNDTIVQHLFLILH